MIDTFSSKLKVQSSKVKLLILIFLAYSLQLKAGNAAEATFTQLEKLFLEGRYERAVQASDELIDARASHREEIYYLKGLSQLKLAKYKEARQAFDVLISKYPGSKRAFDAELGIGDTYYLEGNTNKALMIYNLVAAKYADDSNSALIQTRISSCGGKRSGGAGSSRTGGVFSVQVGSFKSRTNAVGLARKLAKKKYDSRVEATNEPGERLYRVRIGSYRSREEADGVAAKLRSGGYATRVCADGECG